MIHGGRGQHRVAILERLHVEHAQVKQRDRLHVILQIELLLSHARFRTCLLLNGRKRGLEVLQITIRILVDMQWHDHMAIVHSGTRLFVGLQIKTKQLICIKFYAKTQNVHFS